MRAVAGDFCDFLTLEGRKLGILVADVTGHGVPAALITSMLKVAFAMQTGHAQNPERVLVGLNQALCGKFEEHFVTAAYLYADLDAKIVGYAGAGHPPLLLASRSNGETRSIEQNGLFLAMQSTHRSKSRCNKTIASCFTPMDCPNPLAQEEKSLAFRAANNSRRPILAFRRQRLQASYSVKSPDGAPALQAVRGRMT